MPDHVDEKPIKCRGCGKAAATTDGVDLFFGGHKVPGCPLLIRFPCDSCSFTIEWISGRGGKRLTQSTG